MNDDEILILTEFIRQAPNRLKVLKTLDNKTLMPSEISHETNIHNNNVSRALKQLKQNGLVYLINPDAKKGRLYRLTDEGMEVLKNL